MTKKTVSLDMGNGGREMQELLDSFLGKFNRSNWKNSQDDAATLNLPSGENLVFTTDSFVVSPFKFPGGNIGDLAFSGTVNDIVVMGADPLGISLSLIIEEGFPIEDLEEIIETISCLSRTSGIGIATGDTKVVEKGSLDKIVINTSGVGITKRVLNEKIEPGDKVIVSGSIAEHAVALLSQRFDFQTSVTTDSKPLNEEMKEIRDLIKLAKDPTRGGIASTLNEIAINNKVEIIIEEKEIPIQKEVKAACKLLGIEAYDLANEGRLICIVKKENANQVLEKLRTFNSSAQIIGEVSAPREKGIVLLKTDLGTRILSIPSGKIVPRIC